MTVLAIIEEEVRRSLSRHVTRDYQTVSTAFEKCPGCGLPVSAHTADGVEACGQQSRLIQLNAASHSRRMEMEREKTNRLWGMVVLSILVLISITILAGIVLTKVLP